MHARWASIPFGKVGPSCVSGVISDAHVAGNDGTDMDSTARRRWNSLQEGFFNTLRAAGYPAAPFCLDGIFAEVLDIYQILV